MTNAATRAPRALGLAAFLCCLLLAGPSRAAPVTLEFSGTIFGVSDPIDVFVTAAPNTYSLFITWDPDLLPGTPLGNATIYETAPGETSITFSFLSGAGESFDSDNSFPVRVSIENTPPLDPMMPMPGTGDDRFSIEGSFAPNLTLRLFMVESNLGSNPLSSNDLPTTGFGSGPGTWSTSELDIDRTDLFANISGSVANIEEVTAVPEPSTLALCALGGLAVGVRRRRKGLPSPPQR
ncbi:MAG TPA: PEP-CTERM sorting domain-containing protein [Vicinamibacterales bacterium]|nr:PEP-CTERM sorting domain-containing protein [Vicinamibacterales bacterium]